MDKIQKIDLTSIDDKIQKATFELFRFWTKASGINDALIIKTEQRLIEDLKEVIGKAIKSLNSRDDLHEKPNGWDIGFIIGFVDGNLGKHWYHEYIAKNSKEYKTYKGLRAIEAYLKTNEIAEIKINKIYENLLEEDSNILNSNPKIKETYLDEKGIEIVENTESGRVLTILNNLIMEQIKVVAELENKIELPIGDYFTIYELKKLLEDNKKKTGYNK